MNDIVLFSWYHLSPSTLFKKKSTLIKLGWEGKSFKMNDMEITNLTEICRLYHSCYDLSQAIDIIISKVHECIDENLLLMSDLTFYAFDVIIKEVYKYKKHWNMWINFPDYKDFV